MLELPKNKYRWLLKHWSSFTKVFYFGETDGKNCIPQYIGKFLKYFLICTFVVPIPLTSVHTHAMEILRKCSMQIFADFENYDTINTPKLEKTLDSTAFCLSRIPKKVRYKQQVKMQSIAI